MLTKAGVRNLLSTEQTHQVPPTRTRSMEDFCWLDGREDCATVILGKKVIIFDHQHAVERRY